MKNKSQFQSRRGAEPLGPQQQGPLKNLAPTTPRELEAVFSEALVLHQAGRLAEAEKIYLQILEEQPIILTVCTCSVSFIISAAITLRRFAKSTLR